MIGAIFHPEADDDFTRALQHYAAPDNPPGLSQQFYQHINTLVAEIEARPVLFRVYRPPLARRHLSGGREEAFRDGEGREPNSDLEAILA